MSVKACKGRIFKDHRFRIIGIGDFFMYCCENQIRIRKIIGIFDIDRENTGNIQILAEAFKDLTLQTPAGSHTAIRE